MPKTEFWPMSNLTKPIMFLPTPTTLNYNWNLGSLLGLILSMQIVSGFIISMGYSPEMSVAFDKIMAMDRNILMGWLTRSIHVNGASAMFFLMYLHLAKNITLKSHRLLSTWTTGTAILMLTMVSAFMGYVLPWGQMSFWAATVITNLLSTIPMIGTTMVQWLWGGFSVESPTLNRFYSIHFLVPLLVASLALIHILTLHQSGSSNPISINMNKDKISFHPMFTSSDAVGMVTLLSVFMVLILTNPLLSVDPDNFIQANPMVTPTHIQPEWYFLFAYTILRAIPNKLGGVIALVSSMTILLVKPLQNSTKSNHKFNPSNKIMNMSMFFSFMALTWLGSKTTEPPFKLLSEMFSLMYFLTMSLL